MPQLDTDPKATRHMLKLDSTIRETLRLHPIFAHGIMREVVSPAGATTPGGMWLPQGSKVATDFLFTQRGSVVDGSEYQPLRFYNVADAAADKSQPGGLLDPQNPKQRLAVQIHEEFLSFSLGKHACPGRFFAVQTMKLMLGYMLVHYDFEPLATRPELTEIGETSIVSNKMTIKLRRRQRGPHEIVE